MVWELENERAEIKLIMFVSEKRNEIRAAQPGAVLILKKFAVKLFPVVRVICS